MLDIPCPFAVGDTVGHSNHVLQRARDYFQSCGREPMRSGAEKDLKKKQAARGKVTACRPGPCAPWVVRVEWDDKSVSECLPCCVQKLPA